MSHKYYYYLLCLGILIIPSITSAQPLGDKLKGKILLQVESKGEAWYVNPANTQRYYMGRPADAFALMRQLGIGITNANLIKIPIADAATDDPKVDSSFAQKQLGKIFLQVEAKGEAWYINPTNAHRYFLGRPTDAFNLMRNLGLGIKNSDLDLIADHVDTPTTPNNTDNNSSLDDILNNNNNNNNYKTSSKLTTITFHRTIDGYYYETTKAGARDQDVTLTITGYLKEVAPTSHSLIQYGDRAYEFSQGKVKWEVSELEDYGDMVKCHFINRVTGSGEDLIANLDVPYDTNDGKDDNGNLIHLSTFDLRLKYNDNSLSGHAELEIVGDIIVPLTETNIVNVLKANTICAGTNTSATFTHSEVGSVRFPLTFLDPTLHNTFTGNLTALETSNDLDTSNIASTTAPAQFGSTVFVGEITVDNMHTPWTVTWNLEFPK